MLQQFVCKIVEEDTSYNIGVRIIIQKHQKHQKTHNHDRCFQIRRIYILDDRLK